MYICNCNGITDRQVRAAVQAGAGRWKDVHAHYHCAPQCGKCQCEMIDAIAEYSTGKPASSDLVFVPSDLVGAT